MICEMEEITRLTSSKQWMKNKKIVKRVEKLGKQVWEYKKPLPEMSLDELDLIKWHELIEEGYTLKEIAEACDTYHLKVVKHFDSLREEVDDCLVFRFSEDTINNFIDEFICTTTYRRGVAIKYKETIFNNLKDFDNMTYTEIKGKLSNINKSDKNAVNRFLEWTYKEKLEKMSRGI